MMIEKIIRKLFNFSVKEIKTDHLLSLKSNENLSVGIANNIDSLRVHKYGLEKGFCNIHIGDNNFLENSITLYSAKSKIKIGDRVYIGPGTNLNCFCEIEIGNDVMFSWGCTVMDTNAHSLSSEDRKDDVINWKRGWQFKDWSKVESAKIKIGDKCWIGFNSIILKGVELGEGCIVAAGSVVTKSFEPYSVIAGNPAKFIRTTI
jgi:acetyltransferase-like isoleucine patch superfamily enzyme